MNRLCIFIGMIVFGWIGSKIGGFLTAFWISTLGSIVGIYIGWRINRDYFD